MDLGQVTQPRCRSCGQFIVSEHAESPWCEECLDQKWAEFMAGDNDQ